MNVGNTVATLAGHQELLLASLETQAGLWPSDLAQHIVKN